MRGAFFLLLATAVPGLLRAQEPAVPPAASEDPVPPLFESHDPLDITLWADLDALDDDRSQDEEYREGQIRFDLPDVLTLEFEARVKTRGRFRLKRDTCDFPLLRIELPEGEVEGTFLAGQDEIKMVNHCRDDDRYEQNVLEEYLIYRMYNVITDRSMRVRLARITYHNTADEGDEPVTRWGFLLEEENRLAERLGGELLELEEAGVEQLHPARLVGRNTGPLHLFMYMVGNTDYSPYADHNMVLVERETETIPVPYDFDFAGFVDAPYATVDPSLRLQSVRQRRWRGYCRPDIDYAALYRLFDEKRPEIEDLIRTQPGLEERNEETALDYVAAFYGIIDDPERAASNIERACRSF
jgi:hypothetical protein